MVVITFFNLTFQEYPDYIAYITPTFFVDDWLNVYLDSHPIHRDSDIANHKNEINCSDYRFVCMGAKGMFCFMMYLSSLFYMSSIVEFCGSTRKLPCYMIINSTHDYG